MSETKLGVGEDAETLRKEVARLRGEVARLERHCTELDALAHQDTLVPLPNRRGFERNLAALIDRVGRYEDTGALLFIDVDGLKVINDSFGHDAGDAALKHIAELLSQGVRQSDCVARYGGDEFAVLLERVDLPKAEETAERLANLLADAAFSYDDRAIPLSAAIGIAVIVVGDTPNDVIARADRAMYEQKAAA